MSKIELGPEEYGMDDAMPWGKYEGKRIEDILYEDKAYLQWVFREDKLPFNIEVISKL